MTTAPAALLTLYCVAIASFSLLGGLLPQWVRMTHTRTQLIMSLVSGLMLGVAFYHLLPHSVILFGDAAAIDTAVGWLMMGLISMFLLLRLFHFHQHDFSAEEDKLHDHAHPEHEHGAHQLSWVGITLGLGVHTLIDGVALGAVMLGSHATTGLVGVGVFLAILLHKPLDAMSIVTIMQASGWSKASRLAANLVFALLCPLGALLFFFGVDMASASGGPIVAASLAFAAGAFICIALSDLLPEVHFHSHDRLKLTLAFLLGISLAWCMGIFEPGGLHGAVVH
ncbi:MAG: zinc and cadmium transporter [Bacteroidia bacterium]|jgi:zinc and cadmium transporter